MAAVPRALLEHVAAGGVVARGARGHREALPRLRRLDRPPGRDRHLPRAVDSHRDRCALPRGDDLGRFGGAAPGALALPTRSALPPALHQARCLPMLIPLPFLSSFPDKDFRWRSFFLFPTWLSLRPQV